MPGALLKQLHKEGMRTVEVRGLEFEIERIGPRDLVRSTSQYLQGFGIDVAQEREIRAIDDPEEQKRKWLEIQAKAAERMKPEELAGKVQTMEAMVAASVRRVRAVGSEEWDPVRLVLRRSDADDVEAITAEEWEQIGTGKLPPPKVYLGRIMTKDHVAELYGHIWALSTDDGGGAERLRNFPDGPRRDAAGGPDRAETGEVGARGA